MKVILANNVRDSTLITTANVLLSHNRNLGVGKVGGWAIFVATNFFNFTVNFLGNYWCFWWTFYDTGSPPVRRCTCSAARGWGNSSHFFLTPIPTSHKWTLSSPVTPVAFSQQNECGQRGQLYFICTTRLKMGRLDHDLFVCVYVHVWVRGISLGKYTAAEFFHALYIKSVLTCQVGQ